MIGEIGVFGLYVAAAAVFVSVFWALQIRFGDISDLDPRSAFVRFLKKPNASEKQRGSSRSERQLPQTAQADEDVRRYFVSLAAKDCDEGGLVDFPTYVGATNQLRQRLRSRRTISERAYFDAARETVRLLSKRADVSGRVPETHDWKGIRIFDERSVERGGEPPFGSGESLFDERLEAISEQLSPTERQKVIERFIIETFLKASMHMRSSLPRIPSQEPTITDFGSFRKYSG
jgi:hypothetical protein